MVKLNLSLPAVEPDPKLLDRMHVVKRACISAAAIIASLNLCAWLIPGIACAVPPARHLMKVDAATATLLCALGLWLPARRTSAWIRWLGLALPALAALITGLFLVQHWFNLPFDIAAFLPMHCGMRIETMALQTAARFTLLGATVFFIRCPQQFARYVADSLVFFLFFLVLISAADYLFGTLRVFGLAATSPLSIETVVCLVVLALAAFFCRAQDSAFSIFLGQGIGSRIARVLAPILLFMPFLREAGRAQLIQTGLIPAERATAILASIATMVSLALVLLLAWYINGMESEIRELSLRDELTGLYNPRGFWLLADQALRFAQRSQLPFSVLYIDFDNLKQINDSLGHDAGSTYLTETGKLIKSTFRETDVMARIGGDEFAVAGHFTQAAMALAVQRLEAACAAKNAETAARFPFSVSLGHVTAAEQGRETLRELLMAADRAMYAAKRKRKVDSR
jgi:diguanylate cyclase (GGDEF)-like protein